MKRKLFFQRKSSICKTLFLAIAFFSFTNGFSQTITPGVRTGLNFSNWNLSGAPGVEPLSLGSPDAGVFATLHISTSFSVEPGITFAYLGSKLKYSDVEQVTSKLTYLQIPIVARYELKNRIAFFSGSQVSFLLKATMSENDGEKQNAKAAFRKNDFSIVSGVEYYFGNGICIRANYTAGLTDIYAIGSEKFTNYSYGISAAYRFNVAKRKPVAKK